jgi:phosphomevalonate kinase
MAFEARAPGKLVVLGEYAVLSGAAALVMAVDRHCTARVESRQGEQCELETLAAGRERVVFSVFEPSGVPLVDHAVRAFPPLRGVGAWQAAIDSRPFFVRGVKLGLGSSAAALCAFAAAWTAHNAQSADPAHRPGVEALIACHRAFQGGSGSGLDVAASVTGGVIQYRVGPGATATIGSVQLPNSVGFAGVFTGASAKTPDFVEQFERWCSARPAESKPLLEALTETAEAGCAAAREGDACGFLAAVESYSALLERLGRHIGREIVTAPHREVGALALKFGVSYKTSGAGGGDLGLGFCADAAALAAFGEAVRSAGYEWVELGIDQDGLIIEEQV